MLPMTQIRSRFSKDGMRPLMPAPSGLGGSGCGFELHTPTDPIKRERSGAV